MKLSSVLFCFPISVVHVSLSSAAELNDREWQFVRARLETRSFRWIRNSSDRSRNLDEEDRQTKFRELKTRSFKEYSSADFDSLTLESCARDKQTVSQESTVGGLQAENETFIEDNLIIELLEDDEILSSELSSSESESSTESVLSTDEARAGKEDSSKNKKENKKEIGKRRRLEAEDEFVRDCPFPPHRSSELLNENIGGSWLSSWVPSFPDSSSVPEVFVLGDLHGDLETGLNILRAAGLINSTTGRWSGNNNWLIQMGDLVDRGPDSVLLYSLFEELSVNAEQAGGRVVQMVGNHELLSVQGIYSYLSQDEYVKYFNRNFVDVKNVWDLDAGHLGQLMLERYHVGLQIGDVMFTHAGLCPTYAKMHPTALTLEFKAAMIKSASGTNLLPSEAAVLQGEHSPVWTRSIAVPNKGAKMMNAACLLSDRALELRNATHQIVGHTVTPREKITRLCPKNSVLMVDTGNSRWVRGTPRILKIKLEGEAEEGMNGSEKHFRKWIELVLDINGNKIKEKELFTDNVCRSVENYDTGGSKMKYWKFMNCSKFQRVDKGSDDSEDEYWTENSHLDGYKLKITPIAYPPPVHEQEL